ncbi:MAG: hypothetical protein JSU63_09785, partial [Phycisphaerales bacterium]
VQVRFYGSCEVGGEAVSPVLYDLTVNGDLGTLVDCNDNGILDDEELDCNENGVPDDCDVPASPGFPEGWCLSDCSND